MTELFAALIIGPLLLIKTLWRYGDAPLECRGSMPQRTYEGAKWAHDDAPHDRRGFGGAPSVPHGGKCRE